MTVRPEDRYISLLPLDANRSLHRPATDHRFQFVAFLRFAKYHNFRRLSTVRKALVPLVVGLPTSPGQAMPLDFGPKRWSNRMRMIRIKMIPCGVAATALLSFGLLAAAHAQTADYNVGSIHVTQPWARATPKGASAGAAYMTLTNTGKTPERLICVSSDAAAKCQIHEMSMEGGVMKMRPVEGGLEVKPGETVQLKPGGFHVMLLDLKHPLQQGQSVEATLKVNAATVAVQFPIAPIGAPAPGAATGGEMKMQGPGGSMMQMNR